MTKLSITSRKNKLNRSSMTVKLAFNHMKFDAVVEWVEAYRKLSEIQTDIPAEQIEIIKTRLKALEKVFEHMFPKIKEVDQATQEVMEMEALEANPSEETTENLEKLIEQERT